MDFSTTFGKRTEASDCRGAGLSEGETVSWRPSRCELELDDGLSIQHEEIPVETLKNVVRKREHLDIAAGAQIYMEKQYIHAVAIVNLPIYLIYKVCLWLLYCPLYAPSVVKPTLRMPVLLFRRKLVLSRLSSYLYIRCSATSLKAYGKVWLTPGNWLLPEWFTLMCYNYSIDCLDSLKQLYRDFRDTSLKKQLSKLTRRKSRLYHEVNLFDPVEFPILVRNSFKFKLYRAFPNRTLSRWWGRFNTLDFPLWFRTRALRLYVWMYNCKLHEAANTDLTSYANLRDFFTRTLQPGVRQVHGRLPLVSPADGTVLYCGKVFDDRLEQVKGVQYTLQHFLGPLNETLLKNKSSLESFRKSTSMNSLDSKTSTHLKHNRSCSEIPLPSDSYSKLLLRDRSRHCLHYCIVYLAPGDYHRFHSPADWNVHARRHFSGDLFSVRPQVARWLQGLFCVNERALYVGQWQFGFFSFTAVGATNVGSIHVAFDKGLETSTEDSGEIGVFEDQSFLTDSRRKGVAIKKGQDIGHFNLGSTIVLLFEAPHDFKLNLAPGQKVKYGQGIGGLPKYFS